MIVVSDGPQPLARRIFDREAARHPRWRYLEGPATGSWGNAQRSLGMAEAGGRHLLFIDDDDVYVPGALAAVRAAVEHDPGRVVLFRIDRWGEVVWTSRRVELGNVATPQAVVPNVRGRLGSWLALDRYASDFDFISETVALQGEPVWREELVVVASPLRWWDVRARLVRLRYRLRLRTRLRTGLAGLPRPRRGPERAAPAAAVPPPPPGGSPVAVVSAHLDDAVLSCHSALGPDATVITVLAGVPAPGVLGRWDADGGARDSHERALERREEDRRALSVSAARWVHLDFADGQLWGQAGIAAPGVDELGAALRPHVEPAGRVFAPAGIWNAEHKLVRDAVLAVRPDAVLYADLPYALHPRMGGFDLPPELAAGRRRRREQLLDRAAASAKLEACRSYRSQLGQLTAIFGRFLDPRHLGREVFWEPVEDETG